MGRRIRADREKVIKWLEHSLKVWEGRKAAIVDTPVIMEAIKLLKAQEHHGDTFRVIDRRTGKEADTYEIALHEEWAQRLCYCDMEGWAIEDDGSLLLVDECGKFEYADRDRFEVVWDDG